jgi:hypothetical protein
MNEEVNNFKFEDLKPLILNLVKHQKHSIVFEILDLYYSKAKTIEDYDVLGYLALKSEHRQLYLKCAELTYALAKTNEQLYIARSNLYKAYNILNYPEKALFYVDINLKITPNDFETISNKAFNISLMGDKKTSEKMLEDLIQKHPDRKDEMRSVMSGKLLREGNVSEGILSFLGTFKPKKSDFDDILKLKRWNGMIYPGKTIYIEGEGGIGDEFINIRFFKYITNLGMKPILYSSWSKYREDTVNMFRRNGFEVITETHSIKPKQFWAPMMTLPSYLNLDESKLWYGTYLTPINNPKNKIESKKFKIGIKCSGNPLFQQDEYRKIPLAKMIEYLPKDAEIYYIDKEEVKNDRVINLSNRIETWEDTLDFIEQMDCIVSSCTSLVHAAGAIGKTTFVVVPISEYYIWSSSRTDTSSPWYGNNFQVHKQTKLRSWDEPLENVKSEVLKIINGKN